MIKDNIRIESSGDVFRVILTTSDVWTMLAAVKALTHVIGDETTPPDNLCDTPLNLPSVNTGD